MSSSQDNPEPAKAATLADVALQASVSVQTVSRVVNNAPHVSAAVRQRVQESIDTLQFVPNEAARELAARRPAKGANMNVDGAERP